MSDTDPQRALIGRLTHAMLALDYVIDELFQAELSANDMWIVTPASAHLNLVARRLEQVSYELETRGAIGLPPVPIVSRMREAPA